jgi:hypothetical protein
MNVQTSPLNPLSIKERGLVEKEVEVNSQSFDDLSNVNPKTSFIKI